MGRRVETVIERGMDMRSKRIGKRIRLRGKTNMYDFVALMIGGIIGKAAKQKITQPLLGNLLGTDMLYVAHLAGGGAIAWNADRIGSRDGNIKMAAYGAAIGAAL